MKLNTVKGGLNNSQFRLTVEFFGQLFFIIGESILVMPPNGQKWFEKQCF